MHIEAELIASEDQVYFYVPVDPDRGLFAIPAGPAFIKWGQWAATRHDLFPPDFCSELEQLHTQVRGFHKNMFVVVCHLSRAYDLFPPDFCSELEQLHTKVRGFHKNMSVVVCHLSRAYNLFPPDFCSELEQLHTQVR